MKIATWNVNSLRARQERVLAWLERHRPDVLCLQEIKVEDDRAPLEPFRTLGYHVAVNGQRTYNGVAILSRAPIDAVERGFGDGGRDDEARFLAATTAGIRVLSIYVPNGERLDSPKFTYKLEWLARLARWLAARGAATTPTALCGDFNVAPQDLDVHDPEAWRESVLFAPPAREALGRILALGFVDVLRRCHPEARLYTWWDYRMLAFPKNHGLRIDLLLFSPVLAARVSDAGVDREARKGKLPSDHAPVWAELREA